MVARIDGVLLPVTSDIGITRLQEAGEALAAGDPIYLDQASGQWLKARADTAAKMPAEGIAPRAFVLGDGISPVRSGLVEQLAFAAGDVGKTLYVGATGGTTVTPPTTAADQQQKVGYILSTSRMVVQMDQRTVEVG